LIVSHHTSNQILYLNFVQNSSFERDLFNDFIPNETSFERGARKFLESRSNQQIDLQPVYNNNFTKGLLSGFSKAAIKEAADQVGVGVMEVAPGVVAPISESSALANIPEKGLEALDTMKPNKDDILGSILYNAGEFGGATASMPMMPPSRVGKSLISKFKGDVGLGSAIGATSGTLQQAGIDPIYADLLSTATVPTSSSLLPKIFSPKKSVVYPLSRKILDINKNTFNAEAAVAAGKLGIDLPMSVYAPNSKLSLIDQNINKSPFYGDSLRAIYNKSEERIKDILETNYDKIGPQKTDEIKAKINSLYKIAESELPKNVTVLPKNSVERLKSIKNSSLRPSVDEAAVLKYKEDILNHINPIPTINGKVIENFAIPLQPIPVKTLIDTKRSLNSPNRNEIIRWDNPDSTVRNFLKRVGKGYSKDIAEYGKTNPKWHKLYNNADKLYGSVAKRDKLEDLINQKAYNYANNDISYNALAKLINNPQKLKRIEKILKSSKDKGILSDLKNIGKISSAISIKNKNIPNPSGTAFTQKSLKYLNKPFSLAPDFILQYPQYKVLTSDKFLKDTIETLGTKAKTKIPFNQKVAYDLAKYSYPIALRNIDK
jgi:hypothetical protein